MTVYETFFPYTAALFLPAGRTGLILRPEFHCYEKRFHKLSLTARTYHKILRVARTIADTQKAENIRVCDLTEAVCYRSIGDKFWGGMEE